ncbi:MAG: ArnT family glycosyltransferase [Gemmatimonadota bacterium]
MAEQPYPSATGTIPAVSRRAFWAILAIAVGHLVLVWLTRIPGVNWGEDDVGYLLLGQDLRSFHYRELQDVAAPTHARFPPGFPLFIAIFGLPFGDNIDWLLFLGALCTAISIVLVFDATRRVFGEAVGLLTAAVYAIGPASIIDAQRLASEPLFKLLVILGIWALTVRPHAAKFSNIGIFALLGAAMTRTAGVVLLPALILVLLLRREYRRAAVATGAIAAVVGGWMVWTLVAPEAADRRLYTSVVGLRTEAIVEHTTLADRVIERLPYLLTEGIPRALAFFTVPGTSVDNAIWLAVLLVTGVTGLVLMIRRWPEAVLVAGAYGAILITYVYLLRRFIHPVAPFILAGMFAGTAWLANRWLPRLRVVALGTLALALSIGPARRAAAELRIAAACDRSDPANDTDCLDRDKRAYLRLAYFVRDSTPPRSLLFGPNERGLYYHSHRLTINQDRGLKEDSTSLGPYLRGRGVTHVAAAVVGPRGWEGFRLVQKACRDFDLLRGFDERAFLFSVRASRDSAATTDACSATARFTGRGPSDGVDD